MKIMKTVLLTTALLAGVVALAPADAAMAQTPQQVQDGVNSIGGGNSPSLEVSVKTLLNTFFYIIGAVAVVMIIYGGFKYITSSGDSSAVTSAKNTILYAVVGLVVALSAYAIANFVIGAVDGTNTTSDNSNLPPSSDLPPSRSGNY